MAKKTADDLISKYGENAFISGDDFLNEKREIISVSPKIDMVLGGGIPEGSFVILSGPPKGGKTLTALHFAANAQELGRKVYYLNIEGRIKPRDIQGIPKLKTDKEHFEIVRSYRDENGKPKILMAHEFLEIAERKIKEEPGCVVIVDSVSQLCTEDEKIAEINEQKRAPGPVLMARFTKRIANDLPVSKSIIICILHVVANTGGGYKKTQRTGGNKVVYAVDVDLDIQYSQKWKVGGSDDDDNGVEIGKIVHWLSNSTAANCGTGAQVTSYIRYGIGIDEVYELFDLAKTCALIERAGAWYTFSFLNEPLKFQGEEKALEYLRSNEESIKLLKSKLKDILQ